MILPNRYAHEIRNNDLLSFRDGLEKVRIYIKIRFYNIPLMKKMCTGLSNYSPWPGSSFHRDIP